jgi:hypothetical protein
MKQQLNIRIVLHTEEKSYVSSVLWEAPLSQKNHGKFTLTYKKHKDFLMCDL